MRDAGFPALDDVVDEIAGRGDQAAVGGGHDRGKIRRDDDARDADGKDALQEHGESGLGFGVGEVQPRRHAEESAEKGDDRVLEQAGEIPGAARFAFVARGVEALVQRHAHEPDGDDCDEPVEELQRVDVVERKEPGGKPALHFTQSAQVYDREWHGEEQQSAQQQQPLDRVGIDHGLDAARRGVEEHDSGHQQQGEEFGVHAEGVGRNDGGHRELGAGEDLSPGEAQVADAGNHGGDHRNTAAVTASQQVGIGEQSFRGVEALDARDDEHRRQPGADEPGEQQPGGGKSHDEAQSAQPDGEAAAHVGGGDGESEMSRRHVPSAHVIIVAAFVLAEEVEADGEHAEHIRRDDAVVDCVHQPEESPPSSCSSAPLRRKSRSLESGTSAMTSSWSDSSCEIPTAR